MPRYAFPSADRAFLSNTVLIEIEANTNAQQRVVRVQLPDELAEQLDAILVHDQNTNYIYTATPIPCDGITTTTSSGVATVLLDEVGKAIADQTDKASPSSSLQDDDDLDDLLVTYKQPLSSTPLVSTPSPDIHLKHTVMPDRLPSYFATLTEIR